MDFEKFFNRTAGCLHHDWQARLAQEGVCRDRLIRIPTGFGKTAGVTIAWLWNRVHQKNDAWPRRLVLCLPMRTLVEQTERAVSEWINKAGLNSSVKVHLLMGGLSPTDWHLEPAGFAFPQCDAYNIYAEAVCSRSRAPRASTSTCNSSTRRASPFDLRTPKEPTPPFIT